MSETYDPDRLAERLEELNAGDRVRLTWQSTRSTSGPVTADGEVVEDPQWSLRVDQDDRERDLVTLETSDGISLSSLYDDARTSLGEVVDVDRRKKGEVTRAADPLTNSETTADLSGDSETIVLVGCGDAKADEERPAKDLYTSNYAGLKRGYAEEYGDEWAILSAEHGLLDPDAEIDPYDTTMDDVDAHEWTLAVLEALPDVTGTEVVLLAGPDYVDELEGDLFMYGANVETPTEGKKIGERMAWLSDQLDDDQEESNDVDTGGYPFACYDCANRFQELPSENICPGCSGPVVPVARLYAYALENGVECSSMYCEKPAIWEAEQTRIDDVPKCAGHAGGFKKSQLTILVDAERPDVDDGQEEIDDVQADGGRDDQEDDAGDDRDGAAPITPPTPPEDAPKYVLEGLDRQDPETLRELAEYANDLADHQEAAAERELEESAADVAGVPDEWTEDAWNDALENSEAPPNATLTKKKIDGREYYYHQWREGDTVTSAYVAPVVPADRD